MNSTAFRNSPAERITATGANELPTYAAYNFGGRVLRLAKACNGDLMLSYGDYGEQGCSVFQFGKY